MALSQEKPLLLLDLDGSKVRRSILKAQIYALLDEGLMSPVVRRSFDAAYKAYSDRDVPFGEHDREIVALFCQYVAGISVADYVRVARWTASAHRRHTYRFTAALVERLRPTHNLIAVSGTEQLAAEAYCAEWQLDAVIATEMVIEHGVFTSRERTLPAGDKAGAVRSFCESHGLSLEDAVAAGDGFSDASMLALARFPIAVNPNDALATVAEREVWPMVWERKDNVAILLRGGYRRYSFAAIDDCVTAALRSADRTPLKGRVVP